MKLIVFPTAGLSLLIGLAAHAEFTTVTRAYEAPLQHLRLPGTAADTLTFRECPDCSRVTLRIDVHCRFVLNGEDLDLPDFLAALQQTSGASGDSGDVVTVLHHLETDTIVSLLADLSSAGTAESRRAL